MALYTVSGVITKVQTIIEEANDANLIDSGSLIILVSESQKWVAAESGCYQSWGTITLQANTIRYTPPANTSGVLQLQYNYGGDIGVRNLTRVDPESVPHAPDLLFPYFWHYRGNKVSIYPSLANLPTTTTVDILTANIPAALTALPDSLVIPDEFQIVIPYRVAFDVALKDNQFDKAAMLDKKIQDLMKVGIAQYAHQPGSGTVGGGGTQGGATA